MSLRTRVTQLISSSLKSRAPCRPFAQVHDVQVRFEKGSEEKPQSAEDQPSPKQVKMTQRNVFGQPLTLHSARPLTGFLRTGYCEAPKSDYGNHSVAGIVSDEFLDFSASRGNDLRSAGLTGGCKWCLCVSRWKEAFDARKNDSDPVVPRVVLKATSERALEGIKLDELRKFSVDNDSNGS